MTRKAPQEANAPGGARREAPRQASPTGAEADEAPASATSPGAAGPTAAPWGRRAVRIGITGPIGCGKSTVAGWLQARGAVVVDADAEARAVTASGQPANAAILVRFGDAVRSPDGTLDRAALARLVFGDANALRELEAIVHPVVRPRILAAMEAADAAGAPAVVIEAIKLVEGGLGALCDETWLLTCTAAEQRARLAGRGVGPDDAARRIGAQEGSAARLTPAVTRVIDTAGPPAAAEERVVAAYSAALGANRSRDESTPP